MYAGYALRPPAAAGGYGPSMTSSSATSLRSTLMSELHPPRPSVNSSSSPTSLVPVATRENQATSTLPMSNEVQSRLAIAEQLAQLASRRGEVIKVDAGSGEEQQPMPQDAPSVKDKEQMEELQSRAALFQDLGLLGVRLEEIEVALAKGVSLEELLRKAQNGHTGDNGAEVTQEAEEENQKQEGGAHTETAHADNGKATHENPDQVMEEGEAQAAPSTSTAKESDPEKKTDTESPAPQDAPEDYIFPRDIVQSALNVMGVELTAA